MTRTHATAPVIRPVTVALIATAIAIFQAPAEVLFSEKFDSGDDPASGFEIVNPMGGSVSVESGKLVLSELADADGWPHVFEPVNDDGAVPVTYSATIAGGEGRTRLISVYVRVSEDRRRAYRVDFLIEGERMMVSANRFEKHRGVAMAPQSTPRGAFPALVEGSRVEVRTENRDDGVTLKVSLDGSEILEWVDSDPERLLDGQFFGFALCDNGAKEQGESGPFSISLDEVEVSRAK